MFLQKSATEPIYCEARHISKTLWIKGFGNESEALTYECSDALRPILTIFKLADAGQLYLDDPPTPETLSLAGMPVLQALSADQVENRQAWIDACQYDAVQEPLHFYRLHTGAVFLWELLDDLHRELEDEVVGNAGQYGSGTTWWEYRNKLRPYIQAGQRAMTEMDLSPLYTVPELEELALQLGTDQTLALDQRNIALLALGKAGVFDQNKPGHLLPSWTQNHPWLCKYHHAAQTMYAFAPYIPGLILPECPHPIASLVSIDFFVQGPWRSANETLPRYLSFVLDNHIGSALNENDSWFVSSAGGWLSTAAYYRPGPGGNSQIYKTGEPLCAEVPMGKVLEPVAARLSKEGSARFGQMIAAFAGQETPEAHSQAQIWIELGMALKEQQKNDEAQASLRIATVVAHRTRWLKEQLTYERLRNLPSVWDPFDFDKLTPPDAQQALQIFNYYLKQAQDQQGLAESVIKIPAERLYDLISLPGLIRATELNDFWNCVQNTSEDTYLISQIQYYRAFEMNEKNHAD